MTAMFDNLREQATNGINNLYEVIKMITENEDNRINDIEKNMLKDAFNKCSLYTDMFNCLEDEDGEFEALDITTKRFKEI